MILAQQVAAAAEGAEELVIQVVSVGDCQTQVNV